jgi:hypothetical protein
MNTLGVGVMQNDLSERFDNSIQVFSQSGLIEGKPAGGPSFDRVRSVLVTKTVSSRSRKKNHPFHIGPGTCFKTG